MDLTERQKKILIMLKEKSLLSGDEIAQNLNITKSALRTDFSILTTLKLITSKQNKGYSYNNKCTTIKVRNCMSPQNSIDIRTSVYDAIIHLFNYDLGTLVVVENEKLVGIISRKDLLKAALNKKNIEVNRNKIDEINSLIKSNGTKKIDLDKSYRVVKDYAHLYIEDKKEISIFNNTKIQLKIPSEQIFDNFKISVNIVENLDIPRKKNQYLLDALYNDIIEVRYRKDGDRIFLDENHSKKVKEVFIEQKIPKDMRDRLPIFLYNNKIFWIYNVKKAYIPKINKNENKLIKVLITVEEVK